MHLASIAYTRVTLKVSGFSKTIEPIFIKFLHYFEVVPLNIYARVHPSEPLGKALAPLRLGYLRNQSLVDTNCFPFIRIFNLGNRLKSQGPGQDCTGGGSPNAPVS